MYYTTNVIYKLHYTLFKKSIIHFSKKCIVKKKCIMYNTKTKCIIHYTVRKKVYNAPRWGES